MCVQQLLSSRLRIETHRPACGDLHARLCVNENQPFPLMLLLSGPDADGRYIRDGSAGRKGTLLADRCAFVLVRRRLDVCVCEVLFI